MPKRPMAGLTEQTAQWSAAFGRSYTERNDLGLDSLDQRYQTQFGIDRSALNALFLESLPRDLSILEVGCNVGNQLSLLAGMGFTRLSGVDVQEYALVRARERLPGIPLVQGSALALPFPDHSFDLVFTSGVLIHIHPDHLPTALAEIYRVTQHWIWGLEYFAATHSEIPYHGQTSMLWKAPFAELYQQQFPTLTLIREKRLSYRDNPGNIDCMYLLHKPS